jgi:hypothetical protein
MDEMLRIYVAVAVVSACTVTMLNGFNKSDSSPIGAALLGALWPLILPLAVFYLLGALARVFVDKDAS